ncbi:putative transposase [Agrobacterium vitis]|nr:putative transposase [Agrobacterium vitis]
MQTTVRSGRDTRIAAWLCEALGVSRSGFHAWLNRSPSDHALYDEVLLDTIGQSFRSSDITHGARRVWHDVLAEGLSCGLHRIERLMCQNVLRARPRRRGLPKDAGERSVIGPNVPDHQFYAERPNQKWVADFTYIWTAEGWLYMAAVIDLFSRRVVGWSMNVSMTAQPVTDALIMTDHGITCSMSRSGNVWDNAAMESFFSSLKTERTARKVYRTRNDAIVCQGKVESGFPEKAKKRD